MIAANIGHAQVPFHRGSSFALDRATVQAKTCAIVLLTGRQFEPLGGMEMFKGFRNFLMRGDVIVVSVGLVVALAFSNLVKAFTDSIINPLIAAVQGGVKGPGLGWQLVSDGGDATFLNIGAFISAIIYFIIFMAVVYFLIVTPYKVVMARLGKVVFGDPPPTKTCPACLSDDLNPAATKCKHCGSELGRASA